MDNKAAGARVKEGAGDITGKINKTDSLLGKNGKTKNPDRDPSLWRADLSAVL